MKKLFFTANKHDSYFQTRKNNVLFVRCGNSSSQNRYCTIPEGISVISDIDALQAIYERTNPCPINNLFYDKWLSDFHQWRSESVLTTDELFDIVKPNLRTIQ